MMSNYMRKERKKGNDHATIIRVFGPANCSPPPFDDSVSDNNNNNPAIKSSNKRLAMSEAITNIRFSHL